MTLGQTALRRNPAMLGLVRDLNRSGKLVAAIRTDLVNAGVQFEDAEVVVDRPTSANLLWRTPVNVSRSPALSAGNTRSQIGVNW